MLPIVREPASAAPRVANGATVRRPAARVAEPSLRPSLRLGWRVSLLMFALAGLTGTFFRLAAAQGWWAGLSPVNVRHAHSHLMYFCWATPALMALMTARIEAATGRRMRGIERVLVIVFVLGFVAYPPFLLYGYTPAVIGTARLPLGMMAAGLNVIGWYAFVWLYVRERRAGFSGAEARRFDLAVGLLVLSTLGAWGLAITQGKVPYALTQAFVHVFLDIFSEGWFVVGVLALAFSAAEADGRPLNAHRALWLVVAGVPFTFALAMPSALVPPVWQSLAGAGSLLVGAGLLLALVPLWQRLASPLWRMALALLAFKAAAQLAVAFAPAVHWSELTGMRILYVHLMLLGFVTIGLVAAARTAGAATRGATALVATVLVLLASLLPLTMLWPAMLRGPWIYAVAAVAALGPPLVALWMAAGERSRPPLSGTAGR